MEYILNPRGDKSETIFLCNGHSKWFWMTLTNNINQDERSENTHGGHFVDVFHCLGWRTLQGLQVNATQNL